MNEELSKDFIIALFQFENLNVYEKAILLELLKSQGSPLSTTQISRMCGIKWTTANKHLNSLSRKRNTVHKIRGDNVTLWRMNESM